MRISDWSSDVCSSDLRRKAPQEWRFYPMSRRRSGGFFDLFEIVELPQRVAGDTLERGPVDLETLRAVARQFVACDRHPGAIGRQFLEGEFKAGAAGAIIEVIDQMRHRKCVGSGKSVSGRGDR